MITVVNLLCFRDVNGHQGCKGKQEYGEFQSQHFFDKVFLLLIILGYRVILPFTWRSSLPQVNAKVK
jgi:hypothetical protein